MVQKDDGKSGSRTVSRDAHWIEWATGLLCTLLVVAMIGWIGYEAATTSGGTPDLIVRITAQREVSGGHQVSFVVENRGTRTAAGVPVTGTLMDGSAVIETREVTFDYVPDKSSATGSLLFKENPAAHTLDLRASGYTDP